MGETLAGGDGAGVAVRDERRRGATLAPGSGADRRSGLRGVLRRRRAWIKRHPSAYLAYRAAVGVVGAAVTVLGLVLVPLPGPGWLVVFVGLGILATEFAWAQDLLTFARTRVHAFHAWALRQSLAVRAGIGLATALLVAGVLGGYLAWRGVPGWVPFLG